MKLSKKRSAAPKVKRLRLELDEGLSRSLEEAAIAAGIKVEELARRLLAEGLTKIPHAIISAPA